LGKQLQEKLYDCDQRYLYAGVTQGGIQKVTLSSFIYLTIHLL